MAWIWLATQSVDAGSREIGFIGFNPSIAVLSYAIPGFAATFGIASFDRFEPRTAVGISFLHSFGVEWRAGLTIGSGLSRSLSLEECSFVEMVIFFRL